MNEKLHALHHELFYPAFLGAVLFEFVRAFAQHSLGLLWFLSALWFVVYFSVAFLALGKTVPGKFGIIAFAANFLEIALILYVAFSFEPHANSGQSDHSAAANLKYNIIFLGWFFIPITAAISNYNSGRIVHGTISIVAMLVAVIGWFLWCNDPDLGGIYWGLLGVMYLLLVPYFVVAFGTAAALPPCRVCLDFRLKEGTCCQPEWAPADPPTK